MNVTQRNLWAPWRIGYIIGAGEKTNGCFLCDGRDRPEQDDQHLVLWRTASSLVILNRYPYNNGHLLIAPNRHIADLEEATEQEMLDLFRLVRETQHLLSLAVNPHGFNVGINFGRCAGAGLPGHMHIHVVPRWNGDTNFMSVCSEAKVISQSLEDLLIQLRQTAREHGLPRSV